MVLANNYIYLHREEPLVIWLPQDHVPTTRGPGQLQVSVRWSPPGLWHCEGQGDLLALATRCQQLQDAMKDSLAMGTPVGHVSGLDSFTCVYTKYGIKVMSVEIAILPCDRKRGAFSAPGDSDATVLERGGGMVGMLTGGGSVCDELHSSPFTNLNPST